MQVVISFTTADSSAALVRMSSSINSSLFSRLATANCFSSRSFNLPEVVFSYPSTCFATAPTTDLPSPPLPMSISIFWAFVVGTRQ